MDQVQPFVITPWREQSELLQVRRQLFQLGESRRVDERREAVDKVVSWKVHGNVPHEVESTALLVDAMLHHDVHVNSTFSIRAVYSAAFCRFVTGLCDAEVGGMYDAAQKIKMPASFVELRHEATHEELPTLLRLERFAKAGLTWLWQYYWKDLDAPSSDQSTTPSGAENQADKSTVPTDDPEIKNELQEVLKSYLARRKAEIKSGPRGLAWHETSSQHADPSCRSCVRLCLGDQARLSMLSSILVKEKLMFPADKQLNGSVTMTGAFIIWNPLLLLLARHLPSFFLYSLTTKLVDLLALPSYLSVTLDPLLNATYQWILHLLTSGTWGNRHGRANRQNELKTTTIKTCLGDPGYWMQKLGRELIEASNDDFKRDWAPLFNESLPDHSTNRIQVPEAVTLSGSPQDGEEEDHEMRGWSKWEGLWKPKPIGLIDA